MRILVTLMLLFAALPATAQTAPSPPAPATAPADPAIVARANELPALINGTTTFDSYFAPSFKAAIPRDKWDPLVAQLIAQMGKPIALASFAAANPWSGTARIKFERGIVNIQLAIEPTAPN